MDRVFEKGNRIKTPDVEGTVEEIGFRATKVRQFDKALVTIPNSKLANEALINYSRTTNRRIHWMIGVEYRSTTDQNPEYSSGHHNLYSPMRRLRNRSGTH